MNKFSQIYYSLLSRIGVEVFKDIPKYEGKYKCSNLGNIKSLKRVVKNQYASYFIKEKMLKKSMVTTGYKKVELCKNGQVTSIKVATLVTITFLNHISDITQKIIVDHKDYIRTNDTLYNLQLISQRENTSRRKRGVSKYTGVYWNKPKKKWQANIRINSKLKHLGHFNNEKDAHRAYQKRLNQLNK